MADNLNIPQVQAAQNQKEVTINAATVQLSGAIADFFPITVTANYVLSAANFEQYAGFLVSGNASTYTFTIPAVKRANFYIINSGTAALTVTVGSTTVSLGASGLAFFRTDGTTNGLFVNTVTIQSGAEFDIGLIVPGRPLAAQNAYYPVNGNGFTLPAGLTGTNFVVGTNPAATAVVNLFKNGSNIGNLSISTGGVVTVTFASSVSFTSGDKFNMQMPSPQDTTLADFSANFKATKN